MTEHGGSSLSSLIESILWASTFWGVVCRFISSVYLLAIEYSFFCKGLGVSMIIRKFACF